MISFGWPVSNCSIYLYLNCFFFDSWLRWWYLQLQFNNRWKGVGGCGLNVCHLLSKEIKVCLHQALLYQAFWSLHSWVAGGFYRLKNSKIFLKPFFFKIFFPRDTPGPSASAVVKNVNECLILKQKIQTCVVNHWQEFFKILNLNTVFLIQNKILIFCYFLIIDTT